MLLHTLPVRKEEDLDFKHAMANFFNNLFRGRSKVDPRVFKHPLAMQTKWTPLKWGGLNFRSHALHIVDNGNYVFAPTWKSYATGIGFSVLMLMVALITLPEGTQVSALITLLSVVLIYIAVIRKIFFKGTFDFLNGVYWKRIREPGSISDIGRKKNMAYITDIGAVQVLRERVQVRHGSYHSYELNLVLKDGNRLNVVDHRNKEAIWKEASQLAKRLGVPLWDTTRRMRSQGSR